jgi:hypothetical protein
MTSLTHLLSFFNHRYKEDLVEYGLPEDSGETASSVTDRSPDQIVIERLASKVKMEAVIGASAPEQQEPPVEEDAEQAPEMEG